MLTADTLRLLADAAESHASDPREDTAENRRRTQALWIAAADARQVAEAGSGYGTPETLALAIVIDNDREFAEWRAGMVGQFLAESYADEAANADEEDALRISYIADALAQTVEAWAGFEGVTTRIVNTRMQHGPELYGVEDAESARFTLPDVAHALARAAFRNVDWMGLARHYVSEAKLNG